MGKGRYEDRTQHKDGTLWKILLLLVFLLAGAVLCVCLLTGGKKSVQTPNGILPEQITDGEKNANSIAIPGYEGIHLESDTKAQSVGFPNPSQNACYFQITLFLEDGTQLWQSELVKPGEISEPIFLSQPLAKGTYSNARLRFDCFSMDEKCSALNGAETKLTLWVG